MSYSQRIGFEAIWKMTKSFSINFSFVCIIFVVFFLVISCTLRSPFLASFTSASCFVCRCHRCCFIFLCCFVNAFLSINCDARFYEFNGQMSEAPCNKWLCKQMDKREKKKSALFLLPIHIICTACAHINTGTSTKLGLYFFSNLHYKLHQMKRKESTLVRC